MISVMMPAYNAAHYIGDAIRSVLAQTYEDWELIVVNDGSTDDTVALVRVFNDPRIRLVEQSNRGEAAARNRALELVQGAYIAFLDADDRYLPHHLESLLSELEENPNLDGVYSDGWYVDQQGRFLQTLSSRRRGPFSGDIFAEVVRGPDVFGPPLCVLLRAEPVRTQQLRFNTDIVIGPDWEFFAKYTEYTTFGYVGAVTCHYRIHDSNITGRIDLRQRATELAKCRRSTTHLHRFAQCPIEVRFTVYYDLLAVLLADQPDQQQAIIDTPQFQALPQSEQATLLRLVAGRAIVKGHAPEIVHKWLQQSRRLNPADWRGAILQLVYQLHPPACEYLLRLRTHRQQLELERPFSDISRDALAIH